MYFEFSDSIKNEILFAMEDQTSEYFFDCKNLTLVNKNEFKNLKSENNFDNFDDRFVKIPKWTSADGFALLEEFVDSLYSPLAREDLKRTLSSGRGVFRNFKNVLKMYPNVEKRFTLFKNKKMQVKIADWYNNLRESWGLEALESIDEDSFSTEELVLNDFEFREYDFSKDKNHVKHGEEILTNELKEQFSDDLGQAVAFLWNRFTDIATAENKFGFVSYSHAEEFIGCVLYSYCPSSAKKTVLLTDFFVLQNFRGLGIGKELLSKSLRLLKNAKIQWVIISNIIVPNSMDPLLLEMGFEKFGSGYRANLLQSYS